MPGKVRPRIIRDPLGYIIRLEDMQLQKFRKPGGHPRTGGGIMD